MNFFNRFVIAIGFAVTISCTLDKTDFEAEMKRDVTEFSEFKEATTFNTGAYKVSIEALNGTFFKGYNEVRLKIVNTQNNQASTGLKVSFLPILTNSNGQKSSCPHKYLLSYNQDDAYYSGYVVFTSTSTKTNNWELYLGITANNQTHVSQQVLQVEEQRNMNLNMTSFTGNDSEQYIIALVAPQKPKVAENQLVAGIYKYNQPTEPEGDFPDPNQFSFSEVANYTLRLDPRMPEPSMGNHSSPNNVDLTQQTNGLYYGVVNYTMTGNWTLNFIMQNQAGETVKGTEVPTDFTPGINGAKSELHIDILF